MKRTILLLIIILLVSILLMDKKEDRKTRLEKKDEEMRGLFFSYIEENNYFKDKTDKEIKSSIKDIVKKVKDNNFNTIIIQVRSFSDALYNSKIFPKSIDTNIDILKEFIKESKKNNIKVYAWVNPYRISNDNKKGVASPAKEWLNTSNVKILDSGIYYNPATDDVVNLIVDGVVEVVKNYDIEGIIFDDYFYPNKMIDIEEYNEYIKTNDITLEKYHLDNVNRLIIKVHDSIKKINKNISFGISPDGNIDNNYNKNYADVKTWCSSSKYIDFIMPQIYYGFNNSTKPYIETIVEWSNLVKDDSIKLYFALAFYKSGSIDKYAKDGISEWIDNDDVIMRQVIFARNNSKYKGFALFRYDNLFNEQLQNKNTKAEFVNLQKIINNSFKS